MDGGDDDLRHGGEGFRRFLGGEGDLAGQAAGKAAAFHGGALLAFPGNLSDGLLDRLRGACPDEQVMVLADILDESLVELVPGRGQAGRRHHAAGLVADEHYGVTVAMVNRHVTANPLADIAGKTRGVPGDCDMLNVARAMGICLG